MNCAEVNMLILDYIDNQLDYQQRSQFEEHLKNCSLCSSELYKYELIVGLCKNIEEEDLPIDFKAKLHERLLYEKENVGNISDRKRVKEFILNNRYIRTFAALAAGFLLIVTLRGFYQNRYMIDAKSEVTADAVDKSANVLLENQIMASGAAESAEKASATDDDTFITSSSEVQKHAQGITSIDSSRSFVTRKDIGASIEDSDIESITTVNITLKLTNANSEMDRVKAFITEKGAESISKKEDKNEIIAMNFCSLSQSSKESEVINAKVPDNMYDVFIEELEKEYGTENIIIDSINSQDIAPLKESLTNMLNDIGREKTNIDDVEAQRQRIRDEIEKLSFDATYMFINVKVIEKE